MGLIQGRWCEPHKKGKLGFSSALDDMSNTLIIFSGTVKTWSDESMTCPIRVTTQQVSLYCILNILARLECIPSWDLHACRPFHSSKKLLLPLHRAKISKSSKTIPLQWARAPLLCAKCHHFSAAIIHGKRTGISPVTSHVDDQK